MNDRNDLKEIIALLPEKEFAAKGDWSVCLERLTKPIHDEYRMERSAHIRDQGCADKAFSDALCRLAAICNEERQACEVCPVKKYCNSFAERAQCAWDADAPKIVDLFCGAGGLSLGFSQEGFLTAWANDIEPCCIDTYRHNHPELPGKYAVQGDIREQLAQLREQLRFDDIDVLLGGPPCQGFSMANRQRIIDDPRNRLYKSYVEALGQLRPRFFVMENVRGMLAVYDQVVEDVLRQGYSVSARVLNARDFGVPQNRERLIFIGNRVGYDNEAIFCRIEEIGRGRKRYTLEQALWGLRPLRASRVRNATEMENDEIGRVIDWFGGERNEYIDTINGGKTVSVTFNHKARYNNDRDIEIFRRLEPGDLSDDPKIADIMPYASRNHIFRDKYFKLEPNKPCKTITAHMKFDCNMYIHPTQARGLTPREAARVQSYPDDYFFRGAYTKTYMQIGNSVPPLLSRAIAQAIKEALEA